MSQLVFSLAIAVVAFWTAYEVAYPRLFPTAVADVTGIPLEEIIVDLKVELTELAGIPGPSLGLELGDIKIELTAQSDKRENASLALVVPVFKSAKFSSETQDKVTEGSKVTVVFAPPEGGVVLAGETSEGLDLSDLVLASRAALITAAAQPPALTPKKIDIELNFVLIRSRNNVGKIEAHVIELGGGSEAVRKNGNKISMSFSHPELTKNEDKPRPPR